MTAKRTIDPAIAELVRALARANATRDVELARQTRTMAPDSPSPRNRVA